jgi:hypothetical protein
MNLWIWNVALHTEQTGIASLIARDGDEVVCEIHDLHLRNARFRSQGRRLIGADVPLPLFWQQYADHQHPERNAGSSPSLRVLKESGENITVECKGTTLSGNVISRCVLSVTRLTVPVTYIYEVSTHLHIPGNGTWLVTPNLQHGEVEFCNLWPDGVFSPDPRTPLRHSACHVIRPRQVVRIPHHHLESMDKRNITLLPGDRLAWLLDEENLCVEIVDAEPVTAGICAYMWDAHLAYKVCNADTALVLGGGKEFRARFRLFSLLHDEARHIAERAVEITGEEAQNTPVIVDGVHSFAETLVSAVGDRAAIWPWETDIVAGESGVVRFAVDRSEGFDDNNALRIDATQHATARWKATAFGSAFRKKPLPGGVRFRVVVYVKSRLAEGSAGIGMRLHRIGAPGIFDPTQYETCSGARRVEGLSDWTRLEVTTDLISPAPDRLHVLLDVSGKGTCWFDNVHLTSIA